MTNSFDHVDDDDPIDDFTISVLQSLDGPSKHLTVTFEMEILLARPGFGQFPLGDQRLVFDLCEELRHTIRGTRRIMLGSVGWSKYVAYDHPRDTPNGPK